MLDGNIPLFCAVYRQDRLPRPSSASQSALLDQLERFRHPGCSEQEVETSAFQTGRRRRAGGNSSFMSGSQSSCKLPDARSRSISLMEARIS